VIAHPWGIVLDADVLLRYGPRDLILYLAAGRVVDVIWSEEILAEVERNFPGGAARFAPLKANLSTHFPTATKAGFQHRIARLQDTDEKDRHVMALAAEYEADIVSFNVRHYGPGDAKAGGIRVYDPDEALAELALLDAEAVLDAARISFRRMRNPAPDWDLYVDRLTRDGLPRFAAWLRDHGPP
jgi:predicted nucleic acid-binding protein